MFLKSPAMEDHLGAWAGLNTDADDVSMKMYLPANMFTQINSLSNCRIEESPFLLVTFGTAMYKISTKISVSSE